jgi:hypothetical protein
MGSMPDDGGTADIGSSAMPGPGIGIGGIWSGGI